MWCYSPMLDRFFRAVTASAVLLGAGTTGAIPEAESAALADLWQKTGGADGLWTRCDGWGIGDPCVAWSDDDTTPGYYDDNIGWYVDDDDTTFNLELLRGGWGGCVVCNFENTSVVALNLTAANLSGTLPESVGNLSRLVYIDVSGPMDGSHLPGHFTGSMTSLPLVLCDLTHLQYLSVARNRLNGPIPECIGRLTALRHLDVRSNALVGVLPATICNLTAITWLWVANNRIGGSIPACIGQLGSTIFSLDLSLNVFSGPIPESMWTLSLLGHLFMSSNNLSGPLSPGLCNMSHLVTLDVSNNKQSPPHSPGLTGPLPSCIGSLGVVFEGRQNDFDNDINIVSNISGITAFNVGGNGLWGALPSVICDWSNLEYLVVSTNNFTGGIPECIGRLARLQSLNVQSNPHLSGPVPRSVCNLTQLWYFNAGSANLSGLLPQCLWCSNNGSHSKVSQVGLSNNVGLWGPVPPCLRELQGVVNLAGTGLLVARFSQSQASTLGRVLHGVFAGYTAPFINDIFWVLYWGAEGPCNMTGAFDDIQSRFPVMCNEDNTTVLALALPSVVPDAEAGTLSPAVCDFTALQYLDVSDNSLTGPIPQCIYSLPRMETIDLSQNFFVGQGISPDVCNLTRLQRFAIGTPPDNQFDPSCDLEQTGRVINHRDMCRQTCHNNSFRYCNASSAPITGTLPACLDPLWLAGNLMFTGTGMFWHLGSTERETLIRIFVDLVGDGQTFDGCPGWSQFATTNAGDPCTGFGGCVGCNTNHDAVSELTIRGHVLGGELSEAVCTLPSLRRLRLSDTGLRGGVPACLCNLTQLEIIELSGNTLTGTIPACLISQLGHRALEILDLRGNQLNGSIPVFSGSYANSALVGIDLSNNRLTGIIPTSFCASFPNLAELALENNDFTPGPIPTCICGLPSLTVLALGGTHRTGVLPPCLFSAANLSNASLSHNGLTGEIPLALCAAVRLIYLDLAFNSFSGELPACFGDLRSLKVIRVGGVSFSGSLPIGLFQLPALEVLLVSGASLSGGLPTAVNVSQEISFNEYTITSTYPNVLSPTITKGRPLERLRLLALVACGLSGSLPAWVGSGGLPNLTTLALGGNSFTGPLPTFLLGSKLQQLSAPNNKLTGSLAPLENATALSHLDVSSNTISGSVPLWLAVRSASMSVLRTTNNYLSCSLPDQLTISNGGTLDVLLGGLFGNQRLPSGVSTADPNAQAYAAGSEQLNIAGLVYGVVLFTACAVCIGTYLYQGRPWRGVDMMLLHRNRTHRLKLLLAAALFATALATVVVMMPVYATADGLMQCRYGWTSTVAYLAPWSGTTGSWIIGMIVIGGLGSGGVLVAGLVAVGDREHVVAVSTRSAGTQTQQWWGSAMFVATTAGVMTALLAMMVGVNIAFVTISEAPTLSGTSKTVVVVVFAMVHDAINHFLVPLAATSLAAAVRSASPAFVIPVVMTVTVGNSVVAPMVGLLLTSRGCYKDEFAPRSTVTSEVNLSDVSLYTQFVTNGTATGGAQYAVGASYTEQFEFDGSRCLSSVTVLYTPEFLFIFAIRILLYFMAWWLARIGRPWILAGSRPPMQSFRLFFTEREHALSTLCCGGTDGRAGSRRDSATSRAGAVARVTAEALQILHSVEPAMQVFNLLSIAMSFGMLAPAVAISACGCVVVLVLMTAVLGEPRAASDTKPGGVVGGGNGTLRASSPSDNDYTDHPLPVMCCGLLLVVHSMFVVVPLTAVGVGVGAWAIVVTNWVLVIAVCIWRRSLRIDDLPATASDPPVKPSWVTDPTCTLTEPLLALTSHDSHSDDEDDLRTETTTV